MTDSTQQSSSQRGAVPALIYTLLLAVGIPWYWPENETTVVLGMPAWVISAIVVSFFASIYSATLFAKRWLGEDPEPRE